MEYKKRINQSHLNHKTLLIGIELNELELVIFYLETVARKSRAARFLKQSQLESRYLTIYGKKNSDRNESDEFSIVKNAVQG